MKSNFVASITQIQWFIRIHLICFLFWDDSDSLVQSFAFSSFDVLATADVFILTAILNIVPKKDCIQGPDWSDLTQGSSDYPMK